MNEQIRSHAYRIEWRITQHGQTVLVAPDEQQAIEHLRTMLGITTTEHIAIITIQRIDDDPACQPVT